MNKIIIALMIMVISFMGFAKDQESDNIFVNMGISGKLLRNQDYPINPIDLSVMVGRFTSDADEKIICVPVNCSKVLNVISKNHKLLIIKDMDFNESSPKYLESFKKKYGEYPDHVFVSSNGGSILWMLKFNDILEANEITFVPFGYCMSACAFIVAGTSAPVMIMPDVNLMLGFHKPYVSSGHQVSSEEQAAVDNLINFIMSGFLTPEGMDKFQLTYSNSMYFPTRQEIDKMMQSE